MSKPKWVTPERQAELVKLFLESQGFCVFGHTPCFGTLERKEIAVCHWGKVCPQPLADGEPCRYKPEEGKPHLPCHVYHAVKLIWHCGHGDKRCHIAFNLADDRKQRLAQWQAERKQLHSLAERREPLRGRFSNISRDIIMANQPLYYLEGLGVSGLTFKPFAKIRIASSYMRLFVDLGNSLKPLSKHRKRKAVRHGKALPKSVNDAVAEKCYLAVRHYHDH